MATGTNPTDAGATAQAVGVQPTSRGPDAPALNPIRQIGTLLLRSLPRQTVPAGGIVQVCGENISRVALFVDPVVQRDFRLTMLSDATAGPMAGLGTSRTPQVIHSAVYPVACQGAWYVVADATVEVAVFETVLKG